MFSPAGSMNNRVPGNMFSVASTATHAQRQSIFTANSIKKEAEALQSAETHNRPSAMKVVADDELTMRSNEDKEEMENPKNVEKAFDPIKTLKGIFRDTKQTARAPMSTNYIVNKYKTK